MTIQLRQVSNVFFLVLMTGSVLTGCGTGSTIEDALPEGTIRNSGVYPNINIVPIGETEQFSTDESAAAKAELQSAKAEADGGGAGTTTSTEGELRALAKTHGQEAIEEIEAE